MTNQPSTPVRVRLAPSPTGYIHIGTLRTGLFDFLLARKTGGQVILRIEDTDQNRFVEGAIENMLKVFKTMGIDFDEGYYLDNDGKIQEKGDFGPYLQSKRLDLYHRHAMELVEKGMAYFCFCSEQRLDEVRKEQVALKKPPMYDRHCRNLSKEEVAAKNAEYEKNGGTRVIRQAMPLSGKTVIHDLVYGDVSYDNALLDDQVIVKSDGFPTYHLAVVVDDHYMQISHVIRGEEWIPSTPKHILMYQSFGWQPPHFAHLPLILNPDKSKLSKRQGDVSVEDFLKKGYLPDALLNFIALLGWNPKTEQEIFSRAELIEQFDLDKVNRSGAVFDPAKLEWTNSHYIRALTPQELAELLKPYWKEAGIDTNKFNHVFLTDIARLEQERLKKLSEIGERTAYFFTAPVYDGSLLTWKKSTPSDAKNKLETLKNLFESTSEDILKDTTALDEMLKRFIQEQGFDNGSVYWPLRAALTGLPSSPPPVEVASTLARGLGKQEVIDRISKAINLIV